MRKIAFLALLAGGCSSESLPPSDITFLPGHESDLWTREPAPAQMEVNLVTEGQRTLLGRVPAPTSGLSIDTGDLQGRSFATFDA